MTRALVVRGVACLLLALLVASVIFVANGGPTMALWVVSAILVTFTLRRRIPLAFSVALALITLFVVELLGLRLSPLLPGEIYQHEIIWWSVISALCVSRCLLRPTWMVSTTRREAIGLASSLAGSVLLLAVVAASQFRAGANALAWAMRGDSVNVITISRQIYRDGGIAGGEFQGPTPLPFALVTSNFAPGRSAVDEGDLLAHDIERYAQVWVLLLAVCCLLAGLSVVAASANLSPWVAYTLPAFASAVPLSWYYMGIQLQSGFENTTVALVVLLSAWIVSLNARLHPILAVAALLLAGTVLLAVWSPVVLAIFGLLLPCIIGFRRAWSKSSRMSRVVVIGSLGLFTTYLTVITVPDYFQNADFLRRPGAFPALTLATVTVVGGLTLLVIIWSRTSSARPLRTGHDPIGLNTAALVAALALGTAYFMFQRRSEVSLWGYYPQKFAYTLTLVVIVALLCVVAATLGQPNQRKRFEAFALVTTMLTVIGILGLTQSDDPRRFAAFPLPSMLNGTMFRTSEALAITVMASSGREDGLDIAWRFPDPYSDNLVNFWWLQTDLPDPNDHDARLFAQRELPRDPDDVCDVIRSLDEPVTVHTSDPVAMDELTAVCGELDWTVALDATRPSLYTGP